MANLCETTSGSNVPCHVTRLTIAELSAARLSWEREFQRRRFTGMRDDDALIWTSGFMSAAPAARHTELKGYVITAADDIQGVVVVDEELRRSKTMPSATLAYIRYLATAPWNRQRVGYRRRYRGVGQLLVAQAIIESLTRGNFGRIGLHSLIGASRFYERVGFRSFGGDPAERGLVYLEMLPDCAATLLSTVKW